MIMMDDFFSMRPTPGSVKHFEVMGKRKGEPLKTTVCFFSSDPKFGPFLICIKVGLK